MRRPFAAPVMALVALGLLTVSCSEERADGGDEPSSGGSSAGGAVNAQLPDDLCAEVLPAVPADYGLDAVSHSTDNDVAVCSLGSESGATTLDLRLEAAPADGLDTLFTSTCEDTVVPEPADQQERRCTSRTDTQVLQAVSLSSRSAVLLMTFTSDDPELVRTVEVDLALVESAVQNA